ncbi:craniofacial development protein 2-like [Penaeus monodon]|uniref:craniofacial development protein 2-like n=1 Tax=Penaeus monodon TaxID=6687 RepID=UPI0018A792C0|nr:craniofacial development protein 2-like [Penaeus monodon]
MDMYTFSNEANSVKGIPVNDSESSLVGDNVKLEMTRLKLNILGICETRWTGSGEFNSDNFKVYAPPTASSEEEIDEFYNTLEKAKTQCKSTDVTVIMGDMNAKVGNEADGETIDYIAIKKRYRSAIKNSKAYPGADCGSDHNPVICELKVKLKTIKKGKTTPRKDYSALLKKQTIREEYAVAVQNRFNVLEDQRKWETFKEALVSVAKELIPKREKKSKSKWMTNEILDRMRSRQQL